MWALGVTVYRFVQADFDSSQYSYFVDQEPKGKTARDGRTSPFSRIRVLQRSNNGGRTNCAVYVPI